MVTEDVAKPAWARDLMEFERPRNQKSNAPAAKEQEVAKEGAAVREMINERVVNQLAKLKVELEKAPVEKTSPGKTSKQPNNRLGQKSGHKADEAGKAPGSREDQEDASFLDLFDPKDDESENFSDLFKASKQNWKEYK